jgi:peptidoglycan/LPS O-acetylase OafA/YrhL
MAVLSPTDRADPRFGLLDSVRAIAALMVVATHVLSWSGLTRTPGLVAAFGARLDVGVTVFFVLSGFLLYRPFVRARALARPAPFTGAYAWRRVLRIVPAYWVALAVSAAVLGMPEVRRDPLTYFGFAQIYGDGVLGGLPQAWTLCVEVTFYAFLPLWAVFLRRLPGGARTELLGLLGLALIALAYRAALLAGAADPAHANGARALLFLPGFLDHFALGMAMAVASVEAQRRGALPAAVRWVERAPWLAWAGAAAAFVVVARGIGIDGVGGLNEGRTAAQELLLHVLYGLVGAGLVLPAALGTAGGGALRRALGHPLLLFLGLISYGIYLWHEPVIELLARWDFAARHPLPVLAVGGVLGGVALATASFRLLERPLLSLKRLVPDRAAPPRDPVSHAPLPEPASGR